MLDKIQAVEGILTKETIAKELQMQSDLYLQRLKRIASKPEFVARSNDTIEKLKEEIEKEREAGNLDLLSKYEEGLKTNINNISLLDYEMAQNQKDLDGVVEMVEYLKSLPTVD